MLLLVLEKPDQSFSKKITKIIIFMSGLFRQEIEKKISAIIGNLKSGFDKYRCSPMKCS